MYWQREPGQSVEETLGRAGMSIPYIIEPQGEAITWRKDGGGFYTLSEERAGIKPVLYFYEKKTTH